MVPGHVPPPSDPPPPRTAAQRCTQAVPGSHCVLGTDRVGDPRGGDRRGASRAGTNTQTGHFSAQTTNMAVEDTGQWSWYKHM